jgi:hypothetical protein
MMLHTTYGNTVYWMESVSTDGNVTFTHTFYKATDEDPTPVLMGSQTGTGAPQGFAASLHTIVWTTLIPPTNNHMNIYMMAVNWDHITPLVTNKTLHGNYLDLDLAVDDTDVYWTEVPSPCGCATDGDSELWRIAIAMGSSFRLHTFTRTIISDIYLDDDYVHVTSWGQWNSASNGYREGNIISYLKTGDFVTDVLFSGRNLYRPNHGISDGSRAYWVSEDFNLQRAVLGDNSATSVTTLSDNVDRAGTSGLMSDGDYLYTTSVLGASPREIVKIGVNGGSLTPIAAIADPGPLALSDGYVYWTDDGDNGKVLLRAPK